MKHIKKFNEGLDERTDGDKFFDIQKSQDEIKQDILQILKSRDMKTEMINIYCGVGVPDLTDVWNVATFMANHEEISVWDMNKIWGIISKLEKEGLCTTAFWWNEGVITKPLFPTSRNLLLGVIGSLITF